MRKGFTRFAAMLMLLFAGNGLFALSGGPDAFGYTWKDSNEPGGPAYSWKEIAGAPGAVQVTGLADDNSVGQFTMNWSFHYYWSDYNKFKLGSNGWISFNNPANIAHCFPTIPTAGGAGDNILAPFMSDLNFTGAGNQGQVWYWDNGTDSLIVEWVNVPWWVNNASGYTGSNTFQLILSGVDSSITFVYNDMDPAAFNNTTQCAADLEIGIENLTGNIGLEVLNETVPADQYSVKFTRPAVVTFQVPDATPFWAANTDNAGMFVYANGSALPFSVNVKNVGNAPITNSISVTGTIAGVGFNSSTSIATGLTAGQDSTISFPALATFTNAGSYTLNVTTSNSQDINPSNNAAAIEVVAVSCTNDTINMGYTTGPQPDGAIVWSGGAGNEGAGVFMTPPSYPATITAVDVFIADIDQDPLAVDPFSIAVYDDSGLPGTLLDSVFVPANQIVENTWRRVQLSQPVTINSGSFYIGWYQGGGNVALGTESLAPISRRGYEIIAGQWAGYRNNTVDDFMVKAHISTTCIVSNSRPTVSNVQVVALPNPSNGMTNFEFNLPSAGEMSLRLMDLQGKVVFNTNKTVANAGLHQVAFDASTVPAGLYIVELQYNGERVNTKFVVNR
jgi:hypothetical protein